MLPVELHASIWEHSERAGHLQGGLHGARHRYGSIGTIKASTPYEVRWGYCTVPSVRGPLCVEFRDNFQLLVSNLNRGQERDRYSHARTADPTHNELKHTTTRKTATHERTPEKPQVHTRTHTPPERRTMPKINRRAHRPAVTAEHTLTKTLTLQPPPRASALASGTIACASSTETPPPAPPPAPASPAAASCTCRSRSRSRPKNLVELVGAA